MLLQDLVARRPRAAALLDVLEAASGLSLAVFLWMHMALVAVIYFGPEAFDRIPLFLDGTYLSLAGVPVLIVLFFLHALLAARKIPATYRTESVIWAHARRLRHRDTATWLVQVVTGMAILVLASVHFWFVLTTWPIQADRSALRIAQPPYLVFYVFLLLLGEFHAGIGLYRLAVKWGWPRRKVAGVLAEIIGATLLVLGFGALYLFRRLGLG